MKNLITLADTTHDYATASGVEAGAGADTIDGDFNTYWATFFQQGGGGSGTREIKSLHIFSSKKHIKRIVAKMYIQVQTNAGASSNESSAQHSIYIYRNSAWENLTAFQDSMGCGGNCSNSRTNSYAEDVDLEDVEQIYAYGYVWASQNGSGGGQWARARIYEIEAYGDSLDYATII
jgi:hypothetical protein